MWMDYPPSYGYVQLRDDGLIMFSLSPSFSLWISVSVSVSVSVSLDRDLRSKAAPAHPEIATTHEPQKSPISTTS